MSLGHLRKRHVLGHLGQAHDNRLAADRFHRELAARRERAAQLDTLDALVPGRRVLEIRPDPPDGLRRDLSLHAVLRLPHGLVSSQRRGGTPPGAGARPGALSSAGQSLPGAAAGLAAVWKTLSTMAWAVW